MAARKQVFTVIDNGDRGRKGGMKDPMTGKLLAVGASWTMPDGWQLDEPFNKMMTVEKRRGMAFNYEKQEGTFVEPQPDGTKKRVPAMNTKRAILPVKRKAPAKKANA
jgi:hypothetical protein